MKRPYQAPRVEAMCRILSIDIRWDAGRPFVSPIFQNLQGINEPSWFDTYKMGRRQTLCDLLAQGLPLVSNAFGDSPVV